MSTRKTPGEEFNDPYLWDGSGEPDPEVQRLEKSLAVFRHRSEAPTFPGGGQCLLAREVLGCAFPQGSLPSFDRPSKE